MSAKITGMMTRLRRSMVLTASVVVLLTTAGTAVGAPHATLAVPCERCHTLDMQNVDPSTGSLLRAAPNLAIMKGLTAYVDANGDGIKDAPNILGCLLCHTQPDRIAQTDKMKSVLTAFDATAKPSMHPVGKTLKSAGNVNNLNEFQSNWTGNALVGFTGGTNIPNEVQCVWCHNVAGSTYPDHTTPTAANPNLLYNVTTLGDLNGHCYTTCHIGKTFTNGTAPVTVQAMGHIGYASFVRVGTRLTDTMKTARGTAIKTADCIVCHNSHSSSKADIIRDGISERGTEIIETNCTAVCHNTPGLFGTKGHGQYAQFTSVSCGPCHDSGVSHRTSSNMKRFSTLEDGSISSIQYNGLVAGNTLDDDFDGVVNNAAEATWAFPRESMCKQCHFSHAAHGGTIGANTGFASCLDCHDAHGTSVGGNVKMIRTTIGASAGKTPEPTTYLGTGDFYNGTGTGVCDNINCHGTSLATIMTQPEHTGLAASGVGVNCTQCHRHTGSASFAARCNVCHGNPPTTAAHTAHKNFGYSCSECHYTPAASHNLGNIAEGYFLVTPDVNYDDFYAKYTRADVNLGFDPAGFNGDANNGALPAPIGTKHATDRNLSTCTNLTCHNPDYRTGKVQLSDLVQKTATWGATYNACTDCHLLSSVSAEPAGKSHKDHDVSRGYACSVCHANVNVGPTGPAPATHGNKTIETGSSLVVWGTLGPVTLSGNYVTPAKTCTSVYCHATGVPTWGVAFASTACISCHTDTTTTAVNPTSGLHNNANVPSGPTLSRVAHDDSFGVAGLCTTCHATMPALSPASTHVNGSFTADGMVAGDRTNMGLAAFYTPVSTANNGTGTCSGTGAPPAGVNTGCHDRGDGGTWKRQWDSATSYATLASKTPCKGCHGGTGVIGDTPPYGWTFGTTHAQDGQTEHTYNWDGDATAEVMTAAGHGGCKLCHGVTTATTYNDAHANYTVGTNFWRGVDGTSLHGDGSIQMNGPVGVGTGYEQTNWGCSTASACHFNDWAGGTYPTGAGHRLDDSNWNINTRDFGGAACNGCHGYPPNGTETPAPFLNHLSRMRGASAGTSTTAAFMSNHNDCSFCHGVAGSVAWPAIPAAFGTPINLTAVGGDAYVITTMHNNNSIQINGVSGTDNNQNTAYNVSTGGCAKACHAADWRLNTTYPTAKTKVLQEYGAGGCNGCHGGGNNAAVRANYWPDGQGVPSVKNEDRESTALRHERHMEDLAARVWGETLVQLLLDNTGTPLGLTKSTDEKQKKLCAYCHPDPFTTTYDPDATAGDQSFGGVHNNGVVNVGGAYGHRFWDAYTVTFATTDAWTYTGTVKTWDGSCAGVDCHNSKTTDTAVASATTGYGWYDVTVTTPNCIMCHTPGGTASDPVSGLHRNTASPTPGAPTLSGESHDDNFYIGFGCTACHSSMPAHTAGATATHINGAFTPDGMVPAQKTAMGLFAAYTPVSTANNGTGTCSGGSAPPGGTYMCHGNGGTNGDSGRWKRQWDSAISYATLASKTPCKGCHGGTGVIGDTPPYGWTFGTTHDTADGQTEHTYNWDGDATAEVMTAAGHGGCKTCHGVTSATAYNDAHANYTVGASFWRGKDGTSLHGDGSIQMNGPVGVGTGYEQTNWGCSTASACHLNDWAGGTYPTGAGHRMDDSVWGINTRDFGGAPCDGCHGYPPNGTETPTPFLNHLSRLRNGVAGTSTTAAFLSNHGDCSLCHGVAGDVAWPASPSLFGTPVNLTAVGGDEYVIATMHNKGSIQMNGVSGTDNLQNTGYNVTTGVCAKDCHSSINWKINGSPTAKTKVLQEYGAGGCNGCHGGGNNAAVRANYWPDGEGVPSVKNEDRESTALRHERHMEDLAARIWGETTAQLLSDNTGTPLGLTKTTDEKQKKLCAYCHPDPFTTTYDPDATAGDQSFSAVHNKGTVNVGGAYGHRFWDAYTVTFATTDAWTYTGTVKTWDGSCAGVDCHNSKTTDTAVVGATSGYGWYDVTATACIMCHTPGGATNDPISGLHNNANVPSGPTTTGVAHDDSFGSGYTCTSSCHTAMPAHTAGAAATHINGSFTADGMVAGNRTNMGLGSFTAYTPVSTANNGTGTCSGGGAPPAGVGLCHGLAGSGPNHGDAGTWKRQWNSANSYATLLSMLPCKGCHGGTGVIGDTPPYGWTFGTTHAQDGQTEHTYNWDGDATAEVMAAGTHNGCKTCHGVATATTYNDAHANYTVGASFWRGKDGTSMHGDGSLQMNGPVGAGTGYEQTNWGCSTASACHLNDWAGGTYPTGAGHRLDDSNWNINTVNFGGARCDSCHGYPPTSVNASHAPGMTPVNHDRLRNTNPTANADVSVVHNECGYCHGVLDNGTMDGFTSQSAAALGGTYTYISDTDHKDGSVTMNGGPGAGYVAANGNCTSAACHGFDPLHTMNSGAPTAILKNFGPGLCQTCHQTGTGTPPAPVVPYNAIGRHVNPASATAAAATEQCKACHTGHASGAVNSSNYVEIKTRRASAYTVAVPTMNQQYATHAYAINLGGTATAAYGKSTEAEICWACHYNSRTTLGDTFLEWGVNNNAATGSRVYNYGTLDSWDATNYGGWWKGAAPAVWTSGSAGNASAFERFLYKSAALQSMHGGMYDSAAPGNDTAANIRCSYCHDVHDTGAAPAGAPYLRGTWTGNPFPEDGAPLTGQTYPDPNVSTINAIGYFPRIHLNNKLGGFQINQNNTAATTGITAANMAGLCETCHGGGDGTWSAAEIDTINWAPYGTSDLGWVGTSLPTTYRSTGTSNGHANSVLFGTGGASPGASDVYSEGIRNPLYKTSTNDGVGSGSPAMRYIHITANAPYGFRGHSGVASSGNAWNFAPQLSATGILNTSHRSEVAGRNPLIWGNSSALTIRTTAKTINSKYHGFPCSKCHNPHASRLPRLMITNCLDIRHETFNPTGAGSGVPATQPWTNKAGEGVSVYNKGMKWPQTTAAFNCHRRADSTASGYASPTSGNHRGAGWNRVTPW